MRAGLLGFERQDRLAEQFESALFERRVDARRPLHFAASAHQIDVVFLETVHTVAAGLFGRLTGAVGGAQDRRDIVVVDRDRHDTDARAEPEGTLLPGELEIADRLAQRLGGAHGFVERAALEQDSEFVAAEAREGIAPAHLRFEQGADLAEQRVAGAVAAGVVDDFELIQIQAAERIRGLACLGALERALHAVLELAPIDEAREHVVARVIGEPPIQFARLADVVEHENAARHRAAAVANRRGGALDVDFVAVAPDEQHGAHRFDRAGAPDRDCQRIFERLAGLLVKSPENLLDRPALGVLEAPAGQGFRDRIDVVDHALLIGRDHAVADALQGDLRALLFTEQRFFVELALGDVQLDADQAQQPALVVDACLGAADDPAPLAGRMAHAMQTLEQRRLSRDVITNRGLNARHVVGMHERAPVGRLPRRHIVVSQHRLSSAARGRRGC